jgi:hypothetical protein
MWSRVIEAMLGVWLSLSPLIFRHPDDQLWLWVHDMLLATLITTLAILSFWNPLRRAHWVLVPVSVWLIGVGFLAAPHPTPPALQNHIMLGLLLLMFAVIPNHASQPPSGWQRFEQQRAESSEQRVQQPSQ